MPSRYITNQFSMTAARWQYRIKMCCRRNCPSAGGAAGRDGSGGGGRDSDGFDDSSSSLKAGDEADELLRLQADNYELVSVIREHELELEKAAKKEKLQARLAARKQARSAGKNVGK